LDPAAGDPGGPGAAADAGARGPLQGGHAGAGLVRDPPGADRAPAGVLQRARSAAVLAGVEWARDAGVLPRDSWAMRPATVAVAVGVEGRHNYKYTDREEPSKDGFVFPLAARGCVNNRCHAAVGDVRYLLDEQGIYVFDGSGARPISDEQPMFVPDPDLDYRI